MSRSMPLSCLSGQWPFEFKIRYRLHAVPGEGQKPGFLPSSRFFPAGTFFCRPAFAAFENMDAAYAPGRFERK